MSAWEPQRHNLGGFNDLTAFSAENRLWSGVLVAIAGATSGNDRSCIMSSMNCTGNDSGFDPKIHDHNAHVYEMRRPRYYDVRQNNEYTRLP